MGYPNSEMRRAFCILECRGQVTLELADGSRRRVPTSELREASDTSWAAANVAQLAKKRSELQLAVRQAYAREQEQVAAIAITVNAMHLRAEHTHKHCLSPSLPFSLSPSVPPSLSPLPPPLSRAIVILCGESVGVLLCVFCLDPRRQRVRRKMRKTHGVVSHFASRARAAQGWSEQP